jgi:hypothetical protein
MIPELFTPEELIRVMGWRECQLGDAMTDMVIEKLEPYFMALAPLYYGDDPPPIPLKYFMTVLSIIEEIESMRVMEKIK